MNPRRPVVLCLSGHDPGGGAGIQADIETAAALGAHAVTVITAHTVQDSRNVVRVLAPDRALLREQLEILLADVDVAAIKIGLLGEPEQVPIVAELLARLKVPAVLDPVLRAGGGAALASEALIAQLGALLPGLELLTPNAQEARRLAPASTDLEACAAALLAAGAANVLVTGGDEPGDPVVNHWFRRDGATRRYAWPRVPGRFHGAGCTLAAAVASLRARGLPLAAALEDAQAYTHRALQAAFAAGRGRLLPGRLP